MEIKEKIVSVAAELFMRYGIRSVSMDDVSRELGMSKKTLYQSFSNKDELILEVGKAHIEMEMGEFGSIRDGSENSIDELFKLMGCVRRSMQSLNPSLLFDLQKYHPDAWQLFLDFKTNFIQNMVKQNIERGIEAGHYRMEVDADVMAKIRMEQVQTVFDPKIFPTSEYNLLDVQLKVLDHFIHGLLSEKGKELYQKCQQNQQSQLHA